MTRWVLIAMVVGLEALSRVMFWWRNRHVPPEIKDLQRRQAEAEDAYLKELGW